MSSGKSGGKPEKLQIHFVSYGTQERKHKGAVIYQDPNHPAHTWSGRGRKPLWLNRYLQQGYDLADFLTPQKRRKSDG